MQREARVTSKGQVTIPRDIRRALRVREGDTLVFEADARGVRLRLLQPVDVFTEYEGAWREGGGKTAGEINAWLRELRGHDD
jgi:AbrB family looped-hinge helix DNA binding protein